MLLQLPARSLQAQRHQRPMPVKSTQFARLMRDLGIRKTFALSPQTKARVERMLEAFRESLARLVLGASAIADQHRERGVKPALGRALCDPGDPLRKLLFDSLAAFAEFEADLIRMRSREGMAIVRPRGKLRGKRSKHSDRQPWGLYRCRPPASIPSAILPGSCPSQGQPSTAHSTGSILLGVRSCLLPESTHRWSRREAGGGCGRVLPHRFIPP